MEMSGQGGPGQDDGGERVANAGDSGWGGTVCDDWGGCEMTVQQGVDELRDRVSELEELIQELTEALQAN